MCWDKDINRYVNSNDIDFEMPIDYPQLYAQLEYKVSRQRLRYQHLTQLGEQLLLQIHIFILINSHNLIRAATLISVLLWNTGLMSANFIFLALPLSIHLIKNSSGKPFTEQYISCP